MSIDNKVLTPYACDCILVKIAEISLFQKEIKKCTYDLNIEY